MILTLVKKKDRKRGEKKKKIEIYHEFLDIVKWYDTLYVRHCRMWKPDLKMVAIPVYTKAFSYSEHLGLSVPKYCSWIE